MKNLLILLSFSLALCADGIWEQKVYSFGNLSQTIQYEGYGETFPMKYIKNKKSLYAIGLSKHLKDEIQIFDSKPYIASVQKGGGLQITETLNKDAAFIVYAKVPQWVSFKIPGTIYNKKQFEEFLEQTADEYGIDTYEPFPFLVEGKIKANKYRVFTHSPSEAIYTFSASCTTCNIGAQKEQPKKKQLPSSLQSTILNTPVTILGFYSFKRGNITEEHSYTNMNFITKDKKTAGHCKNIMLGENMTLKLPKIR